METKELTFGAMFIVAGLLLPMLFHALGVSSAVILPMHIPVFIAGFVLSPKASLWVGLLIPLLSSIFTGMPRIFPSMILMCFELMTYAYTISILMRKTELNNYLILLCSMIVGRIIYGAVAFILSISLGLNLGVISIVTMSIVTGIPGIIIYSVF